MGGWFRLLTLPRPHVAAIEPSNGCGGQPAGRRRRRHSRRRAGGSAQPATTAFLASLRTSKRHGRIDGYNDLHNKEEADDRNDQYADLVDSYYDLATEFYEWGWGACFHFADRRGRETFAQSLLRHEYYLASRLALKAGDCVLDCGCGIGGLNTAGSRAHGHHDQPVPGGSGNARQAGGCPTAKLVQGDFMNLPQGHLHGGYARSDRMPTQPCYGEI